MKGQFKKAYFITCELIDGKNYFCNLEPHPKVKAISLIEWDTDINFAKQFETRKQAENMFQQLKAQKDETWKIEKITITTVNPKLN